MAQASCRVESQEGLGALVFMTKSSCATISLLRNTQRMDGKGGILTIAQQVTDVGRQNGRQHLPIHEDGQDITSA